MKIAVAIVHGVGDTAPDFAEEMIAELSARFAASTSVPAAGALVFRAVYWGPTLQEPENALWHQLKKGGELDFTSLRRFMVSFAADALAYQPLPDERSIYDEVHAEYATKLKELAAEAGEDAPLVVISHSLGTVISSNYLYDLANPRKDLHGPETLAAQGDEPSALERGETLAYFVTMGSPLALWSLRFKDFGRPIQVPPAKLKKHHPDLVPLAAWDNFFDPDDVIGYPLKCLNDAYAKTVTRDFPVNVGSILTSWTPMSHVEYWTDNDLTKPVADKIVELWRAANA
jgi:hypothetical protein